MAQISEQLTGVNRFVIGNTQNKIAVISDVSDIRTVNILISQFGIRVISDELQKFITKRLGANDFRFNILDLKKNYFGLS